MSLSRGGARAGAVTVCVALALLAAGAALAFAPQEEPAATGPAAPEPGAQATPRLAEVVFEGIPLKDQGGLRAYIELQEGDPLTGRDVREAVRALHASARFSQVLAFLEPLEPGQQPPGLVNGVRLIFVLTPIRKLISVTFPGRGAVAESILHQTADLQVNAEFQPAQLPRVVEAIRGVYQRIGYRRTTVAPVALEEPAGVALELRITEGPAMQVTELAFSGQTGLAAEELATGFTLGVGDVLNLTRLDESMRALRERYRRAGYLKARVDDPHIEELGDARARVIIPVESGPRVRFHVRGNHAYPDELLIERLNADIADEPLDEQRLQELAGRLKHFYGQQGYFSASVAARAIEQPGSELLIVFSVDEGPLLQVEQLRFDGNLTLPSADLRERVLLQLRDNIQVDPGFGADYGETGRWGVSGRLAYAPAPRVKTEPDKVFEPALYSRALKVIEDLYKSQGFLQVQVGPVRVERLAPGWERDPDDATSTPVDLNRLGELERAARDKHPPHERWAPPEPIRVRVVVPVREGPRALVSRILIEDDSGVPTALLDAALQLRVGARFSYLVAEEGRAALTQVFTRRGHLYAKVEDDETFPEPKPGDEPGTQRVEVRYRIQAGPVVHVGSIDVIGHRRTNEQLLRDLVSLKQGDIVTPEALDAAQQALLRTGLFFSATLTPLNPEVAEPQKTIQVVVRERPTRELQTSLGFSLADGPRTSIQWTQGNLGGRNLTFIAIGKANFPLFRYQKPSCSSTHADGTPLAPGEQPICTTYLDIPSDPLERVVDFGLSVPRLWPFTDAIRMGLDLIHERQVRDTYSFTKYSAQVSGEMNQRRPVSFGLAYEVGYQIVNKGQRPLSDILQGVDQGVFRLPEGDFIFGSLRPSLTLDLRDDPGRPRSGFYLLLQGDYVRPLTDQGIQVNLMKLQALAAGYVPLPARASLLFWGRVGQVKHLDAASEAVGTPGDRRFYLGGAMTLRGFNEDAVQPQDVRDELRKRVQSCQALLTGVGCTDSALVAQSGGTSEGGNQLLGAGAELRIPISLTGEVAFFYEAGNLWVTPISFFDLKSMVLRDSVGVGLKYVTPIGRLAIDFGWNLGRDQDLGEPQYHLHFSINTL